MTQNTLKWLESHNPITGFKIVDNNSEHRYMQNKTIRETVNKK